MKIEADNSKLEVFRLTNLLLEATIKIWMCLEGKYSLSHRKDFNVTRIRVTKKRGTRWELGDFITM